MAKILVLYYSSYGHVEQMAEAVADGARATGAHVDVCRVAETAPDSVVLSGHYKSGSSHPVLSDPDRLEEYDAVVVGAPTRFGRMPSQMAAFFDGAGALWAKGAMVGKVGAAFASTATQHGGQETTLFSILTNLLHLGMTIVGLDYGCAGHQGVDEVHGITPYGATTIADADGSRQPSDIDLDGARYQGRRVAEIAAKLSH